MEFSKEWIAGGRLTRTAKYRLVCFPYAGGGASIFRRWQALLPPSIDVLPVQLPGREERLNEPLRTGVNELASAVADALEALVDRKVGVFGYSMGALLGFEFSRELRRRGKAIEHLFAGAAPAPHKRSEIARIHSLPDPEFIVALSNLGGMSEKILASRELMAVLLPVLRADFAMLDGYRYLAEKPLSCPIMAFRGAQDANFDNPEWYAWKQMTTGRFSAALFEGGHFFIHSAEAAVLSRMLEIIQQ